MAKEQKTPKSEKAETKKPEGTPSPAVSLPAEPPAPRVDGLAQAGAPGPSGPSGNSPRATAEPAKDKILLTLTDSGAIDLGSMREKTREKFVSAVRKIQPELFPARAAEAAGLKIPDAAVMAIYNLIGVGETMLASSKFPPAIAAQAFMWTQPEIDLIKEPTKDLIAKYAHKLRGFEEETTWALVFVQIHFSKMHVLRSLMAEHARMAEAAKATPGPKPGDNKGMPGDISPSDSIGPDAPPVEGGKVQ